MIRLEAGGVSPYRFLLSQPHTSFHATQTERTGVFLWLRDQTGRRGWGEAAPLAGHSLENEGDVRHALRRVLDARLPPLQDGDPAASVTDWLKRFEPLPASARFALETAWLDLLAQSRCVPLHRLLRHGVPAPVCLSGLLTGADEVSLEADAGRLHDAGIATWKIKIGAVGMTSVQRIVLQRWRQRLGQALTLRVDANGAVPLAALETLCTELATWRVQYLEQPLPPGQLDRVPQALPLAIAVDEELRDAAGRQRALSHPAVRALVIKPALAGGIIPALALARRARAAGKEVVVTHMLEAEVGHAAACELALALDPPPLACGLLPLSIDDGSLSCHSLPQRRGNQLVGDRYVGLGTAPE